MRANTIRGVYMVDLADLKISDAEINDLHAERIQRYSILRENYYNLITELFSLSFEEKVLYLFHRRPLPWREYEREQEQQCFKNPTSLESIKKNPRYSLTARMILRAATSNLFRFLYYKSSKKEIDFDIKWEAQRSFLTEFDTSLQTKESIRIKERIKKHYMRNGKAMITEEEFASLIYRYEGQENEQEDECIYTISMLLAGEIEVFPSKGKNYFSIIDLLKHIRETSQNEYFEIQIDKHNHLFVYGEEFKTIVTNAIQTTKKTKAVSQNKKPKSRPSFSPEELGDLEDFIDNCIEKIEDFNSLEMNCTKKNVINAIHLDKNNYPLLQKLSEGQFMDRWAQSTTEVHKICEIKNGARDNINYLSLVCP